MSRFVISGVAREDRGVWQRQAVGRPCRRRRNGGGGGSGGCGGRGRGERRASYSGLLIGARAVGTRLDHSTEAPLWPGEGFVRLGQPQDAIKGFLVQVSALMDEILRLLDQRRVDIVSFRIVNQGV